MAYRYLEDIATADTAFEATGKHPRRTYHRRRGRSHECHG